MPELKRQFSLYVEHGFHPIRSLVTKVEVPSSNYVALFSAMSILFWPFMKALNGVFSTDGKIVFLLMLLQIIVLPFIVRLSIIIQGFLIVGVTMLFPGQMMECKKANHLARLTNCPACFNLVPAIGGLLATIVAVTKLYIASIQFFGLKSIQAWILCLVHFFVLLFWYGIAMYVLAFGLGKLVVG